MCGALAICYTRIDERHRPTQKTRHTVNGRPQGAMAGLAICQYPGDPGFYLFYCDADWKVLTDTLHDSLARAQAQAEFEYQGSSLTWVEMPAVNK